MVFSFNLIIDDQIFIHENKLVFLVFRSAGASLRRYNEAALVQEIRGLIDSWSLYVGEASCIFIRTPKYSRGLFIGDKNSKALFSRSDGRLRSLPFPTRRPTFKEVKNTHQRLATIYRRREREGGGGGKKSGQRSPYARKKGEELKENVGVVRDRPLQASNEGILKDDGDCGDYGGGDRGGGGSDCGVRGGGVVAGGGDGGGSDSDSGNSDGGGGGGGVVMPTKESGKKAKKKKGANVQGERGIIMSRDQPFFNLIIWCLNNKLKLFPGHTSKLILVSDNQPVETSNPPWPDILPKQAILQHLYSIYIVIMSGPFGHHV